MKFIKSFLKLMSDSFPTLNAIILGALLVFLLLGFNIFSKLMLVWLAFIIGFSVNDLINNYFIKRYQKMLSNVLEDWRESLELLKKIFETNKKLEQENANLRKKK